MQRARLSAINVAMWSIGALAIGATLVFAALDQPLLGVAACAAAAILVAVLMVLDRRGGRAQTISDPPARRYRIARRMVGVGILTTALGVITLGFDLGVLPDFLLMTGIGGIGGIGGGLFAMDLAKTERDSDREASETP
ncbi:hypothetical protein ACFSWE_04985 [Leucobacter albus]|uniref:Uncharacterized protein n=1 Tax=Leucobacter albus TaxID=272210 RepID=A0ABW3TN10_9MICO